MIGTPTPVVTWLKDNAVIRESSEMQISSVGNVYTLKVSEMYTEDSGTYKAIIASPLGKSESACDIKVEGIYY